MDKQKLEDKRPSWEPKKLSRDAYFSNVYRYSMSSDTFEDDLKFLDRYQDENLKVELILANKYSDFGFPELNDQAVLRIADKIKRLSICLEFAGVKTIEQLYHLEHLSLVELVGTTEIPPKLNLSRLSNLKSLSLPVREKASKQIDFGQLVNLEALDLPHYRGTNDDLKFFDGFRNLKTLDFFRCKVSNLESLSPLVNLRLLVCDYARNLQDISALENLKKIERLDFQNCPNLSDLRSLTELPNLKVLKLMNCRSISTLSFLKNTNLEYLEFIDSTVRDNDVSFIDEMPNLRMFRYSNRRDYRPQRQDSLGINTTDLWQTSATGKKMPEKLNAAESWRSYCFSREAFVE